MSALRYLESECIIHRDIKLENLFLSIGDDSQLKITLGDFGFADRLPNRHSLTKECLGSPVYLAPEGLEGRGMGLKSDIYSAGVYNYFNFLDCAFQSS